jgi:hypothetical protein
MAVGPIPGYSVTPMVPQYVGEDQPGNSIWGTPVQYLDPAGRAPYELHIRGGLIYDAAGNLFDTADAQTLHSDDSRAIFVMDEHGRFYASKWHKPGEFHHSSLVAGDPVAAAGEIDVRNGQVLVVSDKSGHYIPRRAFTYQALDKLRIEGVDLTNVQLDFIAPN